MKVLRVLSIRLAVSCCGISTFAQGGLEATPGSKLAVLDGFKVELLYSPNKATEGSWVAVTVDPKGRFMVSPQEKRPLLRLTIADGKIAKMEKIELPVMSSMGMLYAFDSLYVSGVGPKGVGLYRLRDTNKDDQYDQWDFLLA